MHALRARWRTARTGPLTSFARNRPLSGVVWQPGAEQARYFGQSHRHEPDKLHANDPRRCTTVTAQSRALAYSRGGLYSKRRYAPTHVHTFHNATRELTSFARFSASRTDVRLQRGATLRTTSFNHSNRPPASASTLHDALHDLRARTAVNNGENSFIFVSNSTDPYHNLSIEHYLLTHSDHGSRILFLYVNRPCVVFGRNQNPWVECNLPAIAEALPPVAGEGNAASTRIPIEVIRRRSGGGTVFHDEGNLNYCAIVPNDKSFSRNTHAEMVVRALQVVQQKRLGFAGKEVKVNERHDIVMRPDGSERWLKVSGSAYKLVRGRALHHGTLLFDSPYLSSISGLLNGLGKDLITTKGVGSVRSPVANLLSSSMRDHSKQSDSRGQKSLTGSILDSKKSSRSELRQEIQNAIIAQWQAAYNTADDSTARESQITTLDNASPPEIEPSKSTSSNLFKSKESNDPAATIAAGVNELRSPDWKYGQTPRFTFASSHDDDDAPVRLLLEVNRGVIEKATMEADGDTQAVVFDSSLPVTTKIWEIDDWRIWLRKVRGAINERAQNGKEETEKKQELLDQVMEDESILERLQECFPRMSKPR